MTFFDILQSILSKSGMVNTDDPEFKKNFSVYMFIRYLSMRDSLVPFATIIQQMSKAKNLSQKNVYEFAYMHIPKTNPYIKYISKKKKK